MTIEPTVASEVVYLVDDDEAVCQSLALALELEGYTVEICPSGEALLAKELPPSDAFLLIDERMPGISGLETLRKLRARGVRLPAAFMTTHPNPYFREAAGAACTPILEKPLLGDTLVAAVRSGLSMCHR